MSKITTEVNINPIQVFNHSYSIHEILIANGYKRIAPNKYTNDDKCKNDILGSGFIYDAFDLFVILNCNGDYRAAMSWNKEIGCFL